MARLKQGFLGAIQGILGTAEGYVRKGVPLIRAKKRKTKTKATPAQLAQRKRMAVVNKFVQTMTPYVRTGFDLVSQNTTRTANNAAKSYQMRHAVQGDYPNFTINYPAVLLTQGILAPPLNPRAVAVADGVQFQWDYDPASAEGDARDQVMMLVHAAQLVYDPNGKKETSVYSMSGARRKSCEDILELPAHFKNTELHLFISMISDDRKAISDSVYIGTLTLV